MSVVPQSHLALCRARRQLRSALDNTNWQSVGELDRQLGEALNNAAEDPLCDKGALLGELQHVLTLYRELIEGCRSQVAQLASR